MFKIGFQNLTECNLALNVVTSPTMSCDWFTYCNCSSHQNKSDLWALKCCFCKEEEWSLCLAEQKQEMHYFFERAVCFPLHLPMCMFCPNSRAEDCKTLVSTVRCSVQAWKGKIHAIKSIRTDSFFPVSQSINLWTFVSNPDLLSLANRACLTAEQKLHWAWNMLCK